MLSKKLEKALNEQINHEFASSYLYLSMAAYAESENLPGFASWLKLQTKEEMGHAMKLYKFVNERGGKVELMALQIAGRALRRGTWTRAQDHLAHQQALRNSSRRERLRGSGHAPLVH